jgi:hypothetical protein
MVRMMTRSEMYREVSDMVDHKFIKLSDASRVLGLYHRGYITEQEQFEMFQELVDVATIKKLSR